MCWVVTLPKANLCPRKYFPLPRVIESDQSILNNHLLPFFGNEQLDAVNARMMDRYKAYKRTQKHQYGIGYSTKSINNHLSVLHRIFAKAIEYELLDKNPVTKTAWLRKERTSEDSRNFWTPDDEHKVMATLETWKDIQPQRRLIILIQVVTGLRFSEIRVLEPRDVDLQTPGLWVRRAMARKKIGTPKNKQARFQVIPRGLAEELESWLLMAGEGKSLLFTSPKGGPLANNSLNRWYRVPAEIFSFTAGIAN